MDNHNISEAAVMVNIIIQYTVLNITEYTVAEYL